MFVRSSQRAARAHANPDCTGPPTRSRYRHPVARALSGTSLGSPPIALYCVFDALAMRRTRE